MTDCKIISKKLKKVEKILQNPDEKSNNKFIVKISLIKYCTAHRIVIYEFTYILEYNNILFYNFSPFYRLPLCQTLYR